MPDDEKGPVARLIEFARGMRIEVEHATLADDATGDEKWAGYLLIDQHAFLGLRDALAACEGIEEHHEVNEPWLGEPRFGHRERWVATTPWKNADD